MYVVSGGVEQRDEFYAIEAAWLIFERAGLLICGDAAPAIALDVGHRTLADGWERRNRLLVIPAPL